jgi:hypothetical protein
LFVIRSITLLITSMAAFTHEQVQVVEFFEKNKLNLYNVNSKKLPINKSGNGFSWDELTLNDVGPDKYFHDRSIGFLSGYQLRSHKHIITLDFDIYNSTLDAEHPLTKSLLVEFLKIDKKTNPMKIGHFKSSTCFNYGVLLDITSNQSLISYFSSIVNKKNEQACKIQGNNEVGNLEILFKTNVVLPPTTTICKKCKTPSHARQFVNSDNLGFTPISDDIATWIISFIEKYKKSQEKSKNPRSTSNTTSNIQVNDVINNLPTETVIKLIACISTDRLNTSYQEWSKITSIVYNTNNSKEVCKAFWERGKVGTYANVTYNEVEKCFYSHSIYPEFDPDILVRIARYDDPPLFFQSFNTYDEPTFLSKNITFKDENNKDTKYIKLDQLNNTLTPGDKFVVLKSPYGTGKTTMIKEIINKSIQKNKDVRIVFLVMRQSLARSIELEFESMGFINYLNKIKKHTKSFINGSSFNVITKYESIKQEIDHNTNRVIISLDSLPRINNYTYESPINIKPYDIVICDEFCSLLSHFSYQQMNAKEFIYKLFHKIIKTAKKNVYFLDGDISNREISYLENYLEYTGVPTFNTAKGNSYNIKITYDQDYYLREILDDLKKGKNVCVISTSASFCDKLEALLKDAGYDSTKVFKITGRSSDIDKQSLVNVNQLFIQYRLVIFSPTISVGVDFNQRHFDKIYGQICLESITPREYWQMLARIRTITDPNILILAPEHMVLQGLYYCKTFQDIKTINMDKKVDGLRYIETWNKWEQDNKRFFLDIFKWYGDRKGHKITIPIIKSKSDNPLKVEKQTAKEDRPKKRYKVSIKDLNKIKDVMDIDFSLSSVFNAKLLDNEEIIEVTEKTKNNIATREDKLNYEKTIYYNVFKLDPSITLGEFETYYRKLHILKGFNTLKKWEDHKYKLDTNDTEYRSKFDKDILRNKLNYFNTIKKIINFNDKNFVKKSDFDNISDNLVTIFKDDYFKTLYNIEKDVTFNPSSKYYNHSILNTINIAFNEVGIMLKGKNKRFGNEINYCFELENSEIINNYLISLAKNQSDN